MGSLIELVPFDDFEDGGGGGHGEAVAAQGGGVEDPAVLGCGVEFGDVGFGAHDANGQSAAYAFTEGHDVGSDVPELVAEDATGAGATGPDLVGDEQEVVGVAEFAEFGEVVGVWDVDPAFALDRFDDDGDGVVVNGGFDSVDVVVGDVGEAGEEGFEALTYGELPSGSHGGEGATVETEGGGDDFVAAELADGFPTVGFAIETGEFDGGFVGVGTGVREEGLPAKAESLDALGGIDLGFGVEEVADMPEFIGLVGDGFDQFLVAVAEDWGTEAGEEVDIAFTFEVV